MILSLMMMVQSVPLNYFDVFDFFEDPSGKIDDLIGDGNVCYDCDI